MSIKDEVLAGLLSFRNDDQYAQGVVTLQVTEAYKDGTCELAFSDQNRRHYLRVDLLALVAIASQMEKAEAP